jgi:hypothetical protein
VIISVPVPLKKRAPSRSFVESAGFVKLLSVALIVSALAVKQEANLQTFIKLHRSLFCGCFREAVPVLVSRLVLITFVRWLIVFIRKLQMKFCGLRDRRLKSIDRKLRRLSMPLRQSLAVGFLKRQTRLEIDACIFVTSGLS